jgi:hypothetical protein
MILLEKCKLLRCSKKPLCILKAKNKSYTLNIALDLVGGAHRQDKV